jgi:hypothetical protein
MNYGNHANKFGGVRVNKQLFNIRITYTMAKNKETTIETAVALLTKAFPVMSEKEINTFFKKTDAVIAKAEKKAKKAEKKTEKKTDKKAVKTEKKSAKKEVKGEKKAIKTVKKAVKASVKSDKKVAKKIAKKAK